LENELQFTQATTPVQPLGLSEAVRLLQATEGDEQILLTWSVPSDTGGVAITDYLVEYQTNDGTGWQTFSDGVSASTGATITGLVNGVSYDLRVTPRTSLGDGTADTVRSFVPYGLPAAPSAPAVVGGVGAITATWSSVSDNGRPITDYVVQYATSPSAGWTTFTDGVSSGRTATLAGVPTGINLYVRVAAVNEAGTGAFSTAGGPAVATAVPDAPVSLVTQVNSDGTIGLSWAAPANDGGSAITDYVIQYRRTVSSTWSTYSDGVSTSRAATVSGLARASGPYVFRVLAKNAVGTGAASATSSDATPLAVPGIVRSLTATAGNGQIDVSWLSPSDNGGTSVTDYVVEYKASAAGSWTMLDDGVGVGTTSTITGLSNGTNYQVRVKARNSVGDGSAVISNLAMPVTAPGAPTALSVSVDSGRASLSWTAPAGGGLVISDYVVQYRLASASSWSTWNDGVSATPAATLTGLTNGASYVFRVAAKTSFATGDYTTSAAQVIGPKAAAPAVAFAQRSGSGLLLTWNRVTAPSGFAVLGYRVEYYDSAAASWIEAGTAEPLSSSFAVSGSSLTRGRSYTLRVAAITSVGVGNFKVSNAVTY
jgi:predicted RNA-binding protein with TRAM domain